MNVEEARNVADFLISMHRPLSRADNAAPASLKPAPEITPAEMPDKGFIPKVGAVCPECGKHKLTRKSVVRSDGTETDFLACEAYPSACKAIFALVTISNIPKKQAVESTLSVTSAIIEPRYKEGDTCPRCKKGNLVTREGKTKFLGCSSYPKCKFTDYRDKS